MKNKIEIAKILTENGGNAWEKNGYARVYFNGTEIAHHSHLEVTRYNTGNISSATLDGEIISNSTAWDILSNLSDTKFWYDLNDNKFYTKAQFGFGLHKIPNEMWSKFVSDMREAING